MRSSKGILKLALTSKTSTVMKKLGIFVLEHIVHKSISVTIVPNPNPAGSVR
jgi:hypothetical protein